MDLESLMSKSRNGAPTHHAYLVVDTNFYTSKKDAP